MSEPGPRLPLSQEIHAEKYRGEGEDFRAAMNRVAAGLADGPAHYHELRDVLLDMRFLPGGRVQSAIGSAKSVTAYNCFVSGTIDDSFVDGDHSIMAMATEAARTMRMGGGIGYDFSTLRPRGALIKKLLSHSSGPVGFMDIFDAVCRNTRSGGNRRGAQMGVMRVDHPDVMEFLDAKTNTHKLTGFNISLAVTDKFMECLLSQTPFPLHFEGEVYREVDPVEVWELIMRTTWDWAEPGVLFIDAINRANNLNYLETIAATNPCGEQPLPPYGACLLGSFNLVKYLRSMPHHHTYSWYFDWDQLKADIPLVVRAMDNVVDRTIYPLPQQKTEAQNKRRMGLGVTGLANAGEAQGWQYGSPRFIEFERQVLALIARECYLAGAALAAEKGPFPLFDDRYTISDDGRFINDLDDDVIHAIRRYGVRNSHYTSIAPTGTISLCADNISSSIEPVFSLGYDRTVIMPEGPRTERVDDYGVRELGVSGRVSSMVTADEHLQVLLTAQRHVDSAVSKTVNMDGTMPWEDFKDLYVLAWKGGAKGCTTFNKDGKRMGVLVETAKPETDSQTEDSAVCKIDFATGRRECG